MKNQIAVIDFGTSKIVTVVAREAGGNQPDILGSGVVPYNGFRDGEWVTPRQMVQRVNASIREAEKAAGVRITELYVGIPGDYINVRKCTVSVVADEPVPAETLIDELYDAASDKLGIGSMGQLVLHRSASWFRKDRGAKEMQPTGDCTSLEGEVSFVLAQEIFPEDVTEMLGALDITVLGFASPTFGTALRMLQIDERDAGAAIIDCGYYNTEISVVRGDALVYHVRIPTAGETFTERLADALDLHMRDAEQLKRSFIFDADPYEADADMEVFDEETDRRVLRISRSKVEPVMNRTAEELFGYIDSCLAEAGSTLSNHSTILLTGGGLADMRGATQKLAKHLGRKVRNAEVNATKLNGDAFTSTWGLIDLVMDSVSPGTAESKAGIKKSLFGKKK